MGLKFNYKISQIIERNDYVNNKVIQSVEKKFELLNDEVPTYINEKLGLVPVDAGNGTYTFNFRARVLIVKDGILFEPYAFITMIDTIDGMLVKFITEDDIDYFGESTKTYGEYISFGVENVFEYHLDTGKFNAISFIFDFGSNRNFLMISSFHIEPNYSNLKMFYNDAKELVAQ